MFKKYFSCVRKSFVAIVLAVMCVVPFFGNSMVKASAVSYPSLVIHTSRLTKSEVSGTYAGDVKIEVSLSSPCNVAECGITVVLGNGLAFRQTSGGNPACSTSFSSMGRKLVGSQSASVAGIASDSDGIVVTNLFSFYAYKTGSLNSNNGTVSVKVSSLSGKSGDIKLSNVKVDDDNSTVNINPSTGYVLGDVNGDNRVNSKDSVKILSALNSKRVSTVSVYKLANDLSSWFPQAKAAEAVDANGDKYVNSADSDAILDYYAANMSHAYTGNIGKNFYTIKAV